MDTINGILFQQCLILDGIDDLIIWIRLGIFNVAEDIYRYLEPPTSSTMHTLGNMMHTLCAPYGKGVHSLDL